MSKQELALRVGFLDYTELQKVEDGKAEPSWWLIIELAKVLGCGILCFLPLDVDKYIKLKPDGGPKWEDERNRDRVRRKGKGNGSSAEGDEEKDKEDRAYPHGRAPKLIKVGESIC
jgi:hypothetical protein